MLDRPIILLGAARSGTTLLGDRVLGRHPDVAYWKEPIFLWRYGAAYRSHDVRLADDATPPIREYIRGRLATFAAEAGQTRLMEKTPSNCFRVPFIDAVVPDALYIHLIRDGRDVALSAAEEWRGLGTEALDSPELREGGAVQQVATGVRRWARLRSRVDDVRSALELPSYAGRFAGYLYRRVTHSERVLWGPRPPGLRAIRRAHTLLDTCALQWALSVGATRSGLAHVDPQRVLEVRYEALTESPAETTRAILEFVGLEAGSETVARLSGDVVGRGPKWPRHYDPAELRRTEGLIGATLLDLGYPLSSP